MKKGICIFLIIVFSLMIFTGCDKSNTVGERPDIDLESTAQPDSQNIHEPSASDNSSDSKYDESTPEAGPIVVNPSSAMRIIVPRTTWNKFSADEILDWEQYIIDKYDYEINIVTVTKDYNTNMSSYIVYLEQKVSEGGFIYVPDLITLKALSESGLIEPVNKHIGKVERYNVLPDELIMNLSDREGNMWGFPLSDSMNTIAPERYYSDVWLEAADMEVPRTIEEFYEFAMFVANTDLDGNGKYDSYVASYADYIWLYDLGDIFKAFGCYYDGQNPVAYNPNNGIYENCVFSENFIEAITFVKLLYDEGVIFDRRPANISGMEELSLEAYQIAADTRIERENFIEDGVSIGNYLTGINHENICENRFSGACLAIINGTPEVAEKMNGLMTLLMSNPNSKMDFAYGIEGVHYEDNNDDYYSVSNKDANGNSIMNRMNIHIRLSDMGFTEKYVVADGIDYRKENAQFFDILTAAHNEKEEINDDVKYSIPFGVYDSRLDEMNEKLYRPTRDLFRAIMSGSMEIEDAIEAYRIRLNGLKIFDIINAINADLK